jgi:hypothetical protein
MIIPALAMLAYGFTDKSAYRAEEVIIIFRVTIIISACLLAVQVWRRGAQVAAVAIVAFWSCQLTYLSIEHGPVRGTVCMWPSYFAESVRAWKELVISR